MMKFRWTAAARREAAEIEREQDARLDSAEKELSDLQERAGSAIRKLDERQRRNHWREAIENMIRGVA